MSSPLVLKRASATAVRQPCHGLVFMNPPGVAIVAARTSADWFHEVVPAAPLFYFPQLTLEA
jgi:hypothetical protein